MKYSIIFCFLILSSCTIQLKDNRIDAAALVKKLQYLDKVDGLIVEKLKELQDKGYLAKPAEEAKKK